MVKVNANSVKVGNIIELRGSLYRVTKRMHTQPGKGGAFIQVELKDLKSGNKANERFRSSEDVERARLDTQDYQYLFMEGNYLTLMDNTTYDQIQVDQELIGEALPFLQNNMIVTLETYDGQPVSITLPETVVLTVAETEAVVKGQTAASSYKPAMMDNGVRVTVPPFIGVGDRLVIRTTDGEYMERAKN